MPVTKVKGPDGNIINVRHPEGASQDEIIAFAKKGPPSKTSGAEAGIGGFGQGASFGATDEIGGAVSAVMDKALFSDIYEGESFGDRYRARRDQRREELAQMSAEHPEIYGGAEIAGGVTSGIAAGGGALSGARGIGQVAARGAATGAGFGGTGGLGYSEGESVGEVAKDTAMGAAIGGTIGAAMPALLSAPGMIAAARNPGAKEIYGEALDVLNKFGVKSLTKGQAKNAPGIKAAEATIADLMVVGAPLKSRIMAGRREFQKALLKMAGGSGDDDLINTKTLTKIGNTLSKEYKAALKGKHIRIQADDFLDDLADIAETHAHRIEPIQRAHLDKTVDEILDYAAKIERTGTKGLDAAQYQEFRGAAGKWASSAFKRGDEGMGRIYMDLKRALDSEFERATGASMKSLNTRYARFSELKTAFEGVGGSEATEGLISPERLARIAKRGPETEWRKLVESAAIVLPDRVPNSATATRNAVLAGLGLSAGAAIAPEIVSPERAAYPIAGALGAAYLLSRGKVPTNTLSRATSNALIAPVGGSVPIVNRLAE